jgi:aldose 1-epimerase
MSVTMEKCGSGGQGEELICITLRNAGLSARILNYGAIVMSVQTPDRSGLLNEVTLGMDSAQDYVRSNPPYFGAVCGRYANRIAKGRFALDGVEYRLAANNGPNALHGGLQGFDKRFWEVLGKTSSSVTLGYNSAAGEEGYPGRLQATVCYSLTDRGELRLDYTATTDSPTVVNLTNHMYFNLAGPSSPDCLAHELTACAPRFTPTDATLIPTGVQQDVRGTPLDFLKPASIGSRFPALPEGYDHNLILDPARGDAWAVRVYEPTTGRGLELFTTEPGVQLYTGHYLDGVMGRGGRPYRRYAGFCLEAQHFPDSPNRQDFPSTVLRPGQVYRQTTAYRFFAG